MIVCFFVSGILFFFSYQIGKKKELTLIAGFNEETFKGDKNKLAGATGLYLMILGILMLVFPLGFAFFGSIAGQVLFVLVIVTTILLIWYMNRLSKSVV
nr:DUF3784 domain-containing protein [Jeotgalibacillus terrae]